MIWLLRRLRRRIRSEKQSLSRLQLTVPLFRAQTGDLLAGTSDVLVYTPWRYNRVKPWDAFTPYRLDQHLIPFYEKDTAAGTLDDTRALELLVNVSAKLFNSPAPVMLA